MLIKSLQIALVLLCFLCFEYNNDTAECLELFVSIKVRDDNATAAPYENESAAAFLFSAYEEIWKSINVLFYTHTHQQKLYKLTETIFS